MTDSRQIIVTSYDYSLVALSVVLATFASYSALEFGSRVSSAKGRAKQVWLIAGAAAMGLGIWAMHYVGMLALIMPMPMAYYVPTVLLSFFAAVCASLVALFVVSRRTLNFAHEIAGSIAMGSGIAAMHYIGMAAMRSSVEVDYDYRRVILSIFVAIVDSLIALHIAFRMRDDEDATWRKLVSSLVLGSAIPLMHYVGMWAVRFHPSPSMPDLRNCVSGGGISIIVVTGTTLTVLIVAIATSSVNRFLSLHQDQLSIARERELYFQTMAEAVPELLWTAAPDGTADFLNGRWQEYTGLDANDSRGSGWASAVHPNDLSETQERWSMALRTGNPLEVEQRLLGKDGKFRWFLARANPIRNVAGEIVKWCGICTNIESQKVNEQILEEQILERTMQLANVNEQLQSEISEKDIARQQLDAEHEKMMKDLEQRSERATMLAKMGELLQSSISKDEVISVALSFAPKIFPLSRGVIVLLNSSRNLAEVAGSWSDCPLPSMEFEPADCWALRTGHPHLVIAGDTTVRCTHVGELRRTHLCVPILAQGETLGVLHFQAKGDRASLEALELSFQTTFAGQIGLSIANIRLRDALRAQSTRDALTGLHNRRYLDEMLQRELRRASRAQQNLGLMMIDLDYFKKFNDAFGHDAGDAVLREAALCLIKGIRAEDFVCRYGGEEFVIVLPTANLEAIRGRAESLRQKMREMSIIHQGKSMGMITISVGAAVFPQHGATPQQLIAAADAALYEAKRNGRDQVVTASANAETGESHSSESAAAGS